ncbi:uncharacterized protein LODBEIA_P08900 [Lodderomyces beijingensis]|uniref:Uncharacterized protein n=1 Tax=Lodderomyces beijingensis TaxID=1775926 RepID=A0ABP0ZHS5_9ASCO
MLILTQNFSKLRNLKQRCKSSRTTAATARRRLSTQPQKLNITVPTRLQQLDSLGDSIRRHYEVQTEFRNTFTVYNKTSVRNRDEEEQLEDFHHEAADFQDIVEQSVHNVPQVGSIVEIAQPDGPRVGIVVQDLGARFDERHNHVLVLTAENEIVKIKPLDVNFHLHNVIPQAQAASFFDGILRDRHNLHRDERKRIIRFLDNYIHDVMLNKRRFADSLSCTFSQFARDEIAAISLIDVVNSLKLSGSDVLKFSSSYRHQCVLLQSLHWNLVDSPMWLVPNCFDFKVSNLVMWQHSNIFSSSLGYFVNSEQNWHSIYSFLQSMSRDDTVAQMNEFIAKVKSMTKDQVNVHLRVFEGRHFRHFLNVLKFAVIYPHDSVIAQLRKLDVFGQNCSPSAIYQLLVDMKIYSPERAMTDIYLSSGLFGNTEQLSVTEFDTLDRTSLVPPPPKPPSPSPLSLLSTVDNFRHLRTAKKYYKDHVVYGFVDEDSSYNKDDDNDSNLSSSFAVSIETLNSRKHVINIHVPDVITRVKPSSDTFRRIVDGDRIQKTVTGLFKGAAKIGELYPESAAEAMKFRNFEQFSRNEEIWEGGGFEIESQNKLRFENLSEVTCLTISLTFGASELNPFAKIEGKVSMSFDSLTGVTLKNVGKRTLQKCLTGQLESPFFNILSMHRRSSENQSLLNKADIHNLNHINSALKTFFKVRDHAGSSSVKPTAAAQYASDVIKRVFRRSDRSQSLISYRSQEAASFPQAEFMIHELKLLANHLSAVFCDSTDVPAFRHVQEVDDANKYNSDRVIVHHDNIMIPAYDSRNYDQSIMAKNVDGYISPNAKVISCNYLSPQSIAVQAFTGNTPLGLNKGSVNLVDIFTSGEVLLNQMQILGYVQQWFTRESASRRGLLQHVKMSNHFKGAGYTTSGPMKQADMNAMVPLLQKCKSLTFWESKIKRFWILARLQQERARRHDDHLVVQQFTCIVTHVDDQSFGTLCKAYCLELEIEIDVFWQQEGDDPRIGATSVCDEVLYLNPISGSCLVTKSLRV